MCQFLLSLRRSLLLQSIAAVSVLFLSSCVDKVEPASPAELTAKQKVELQLTSGAAKSWTVSGTEVVDVFGQNNVSIFNQIPLPQYLILKNIINQATENSMNEIVFTLVGKYEMRDANNNITESGYWKVSDSGDQVSFAPKNNKPERYFDIESKNETTLTMKGSSEVTANVDNDPEPESVTVKVALELN